MTTERFTLAEFEEALAEAITPLGLTREGPALQDGEFVYAAHIPDTNKRIVIRSSVRGDGSAAAAGQDSIRLWVEYYWKQVWRPLKKVDAWTTRVPGWQGRIAGKLAELTQIARDDKPKAPPVQAEPEEPSPLLPASRTKDPTDAQRAAIEAPADAAVRVLAPPGSGKTFVIARRYAWLLEQGITPQSILAVTFSKAMADELMARIAQLSPQVQGTAAEQQICTIHAICYRMLRTEGDQRSVPRTWQIKKALQEITERLWPDEHERPAWGEVFAWINTAKLHSLTSRDDQAFFEEACDPYHGEKLHRARAQLDSIMRRQNLITFGDMLLDVEQLLLNDPEFRGRWQGRFAYVIVDEGQDTSRQAMRILTTLAAPQDRFFIVGDTDQLLYRFAGATPEANLFEGFEERFPIHHTVKLDTNFRSTRAIVEACEALIANNYASAGGPYAEQYHKSVRARGDADQGIPISFEWHNSPFDEAGAVVATLIEMLAAGEKPGEVFVGARTKAQLGYLEGPLVRAKIPFINIAGGSFWGSKHVADTVAYLRLAADERDDDAYQRVFNVASRHFVHPWGSSAGEYCPHRYLGRAFMDACQGSYRNAGYAADGRRSFRPGVEDLTEFVGQLQAQIADGTPPDELIKFIVAECYRPYLMNEEGMTGGDEAEDGKLGDLETVADVAQQFEMLADFLEYVAEATRAAEAAREKDWGEYIVLSTVHRLKGLERDVVMGVGLAENGMQGLLPHTFSMTDPPQFGILPTSGRGQIEDERCIAFVLASRARREVHLSGCQRYRNDSYVPSRFTAELGISVQTEM